MRLLVQRVREARVDVDGRTVGCIESGLLAFVGLGQGDTDALFAPALEKLVNLRIFPDDAGNMNRSLTDVSGGLLLVSQFTLYADTRKGRRPSFTDAMPPTDAREAFARFAAHARRAYTAGTVAEGEFGAMMDVHLVNDGPVTIWIDSADMPWGRSPAASG